MAHLNHTSAKGSTKRELGAALRLPPRHPLSLLVVSLGSLLLLLLCSTDLQAESLDARFLNGLRQRRLFTLAEKYCIEELQTENLSPERRTTLAIELVQTHAEHALYAPVNERDRYWAEAHNTAAEFLRSLQPSTPGKARAEILVQIQDALTHLAQGELMRQEVQADVADETRLEPAKVALRRAVSGLEDANKVVEASLRNAGLGRGAEGELSADQLAALQRNVNYQLARTLKNQGLCYPADSADRTNSLSQAVELLAHLAELQAADETIWNSRVELIVCLRLLRNYEPAHKALANLIAERPGPQYLLRAMAEKIRLDLDQRNLNDAIASMQQGRNSNGQSSAELDFAHLETQIDAWQAAAKAKNKADVAAWQQRATNQVQLLEREHGAYWMRRAETLLARMVAGSGDGNVAALRRAAESYYRGSRWEDALKTYDQAALLAAKSGDPNEAFALAFTAASIEHDRNQTATALDRFKQLSERMPEQPRAGEAHLMAIVNGAQLARDTKGEEQTEQFKAYEALLVDHLQTWPNDPTADQVRLWLGKLLESRRELTQAMAIYQQVPADRTQYEEAMRGALRCAEIEVKVSAAAGKFDAKACGEAIRFGEELIVGSARKWPEKWSPLQLESALVVARLRLHFAAGQAKEIESTEAMLKTALAANPEAPAVWQSEARLLLVWALALLGKSQEAAAQLEDLSAGSLDGILAVLERLDALAATATDQQELELAQLEIHLVRQLEKRQAELNESQVRRFETLQAAALVRAGYFGDALKQYKQLVEKYPRDGTLHEAHAALLARATDTPSQRVALAKWREVESKTKPGESRWFRARLAQAELLIKLNDKPAAAKLIQLTTVLQPKLGGAEMKTKFESLLQQSGK
jgi:hypothetical protein